MPYITLVKYDVREDILTDWLEKEFGESSTKTGLVNWSYEIIGEGHSTSWKVEAPREITADERQKLAEDSRPKRQSRVG